MYMNASELSFVSYLSFSIDWMDYSIWMEYPKWHSTDLRMWTTIEWHLNFKSTFIRIISFDYLPKYLLAYSIPLDGSNPFSLQSEFSIRHIFLSKFHLVISLSPPTFPFTERFHTNFSESKVIANQWIQIIVSFFRSFAGPFDSGYGAQFYSSNKNKAFGMNASPESAMSPSISSVATSASEVSEPNNILWNRNDEF